jgi:hypothetical protein
MAKGISKNAKRQGVDVLKSRWGGEIRMKTIYKNGKMKHFAECQKTGNTARKPKELM